MALVGMAYLKNKLISKQKRVHTRAVGFTVNYQVVHVFIAFHYYIISLYSGRYACRPHCF